jgi:periplasmic copper chaperone A
MTRSIRMTVLVSLAAMAALSLTVASAAAQDDEATTDDMDMATPMAEMEPGLSITGAWTRESPMIDLAGAAYMVIHNGTDADDALTGVSSPAAEVAELHLSSMDDEGMMSMAQVPQIPIPAHGDAVLEPGGYHLMLIGLVEPLTEGMEVELDLEFMTAGPMTVSAPVMAEAPAMEGMDMEGGSEGHDMDMDESEGEG